MLVTAIVVTEVVAPVMEGGAEKPVRGSAEADTDAERSGGKVEPPPPAAENCDGGTFVVIGNVRLGCCATAAAGACKALLCGVAAVDDPMVRFITSDSEASSRGRDLVWSAANELI